MLNKIHEIPIDSSVGHRGWSVGLTLSIERGIRVMRFFRSISLVCVAVFTAVGALLVAAPAHAATPGGIFLTGHDPDFHAQFGPNAVGSINILQKAVAFTTSGKSNPRMLLVTDLHDPGAGFSDPRLGLTAAGFTYAVADDGSSGSALDLHTVNYANYDVIVVASDFGGWLRQSELDILNARSLDMIGYINNGGGLVALAESGTLTSHNLFGYLTFVVSSTGVNLSETGNTVTPFGASLGLTNADINGNFFHN